MNPAPSAEATTEQPKEMSKSQLKKLAKQKNAKPKMSKEEKMKAVGCRETISSFQWGLKGKGAAAGEKKAEKKTKAEKTKPEEPVFVNKTPKGQKKGSCPKEF